MTTKVVVRQSQSQSQALRCSRFDLMSISGTRALALAVLGYQLTHDARTDLDRVAIRRKIKDVEAGVPFPECRT
jgi:hypothetical protein